MSHDDVLEHVEAIVAEFNFLLIEMNLFQAGHRRVLRVLIDKPGRIGLDECAGVSRAIGNAVETLNLMEEAFTLEVSSPGLTRELSTHNDWLRCVDRNLKVSTVSDDFTSLLISYNDGVLTFKNGKIVDTEDITAAKEAF